MLRLAIKKADMLWRNIEYNNMRELSVNGVQEVNGGVFSVAAVLLVRATYTAYRTNPALGVCATVTFTRGE